MVPDLAFPLIHMDVVMCLYGCNVLFPDYKCSSALYYLPTGHSGTTSCEISISSNSQCMSNPHSYVSEMEIEELRFEPDTW